MWQQDFEATGRYCSLQSYELLSVPRSRIHFAGITSHDRFCYASESDPPGQLPSCFMRLCRCLYAAFQTSLNVARNASADADAPQDLRLLIRRKARV